MAEAWNGIEVICFFMLCVLTFLNVGTFNWRCGSLVFSEFPSFEACVVFLEEDVHLVHHMFGIDVGIGINHEAVLVAVDVHTVDAHVGEQVSLHLVDDSLVAGQAGDVDVGDLVALGIGLSGFHVVELYVNVLAVLVGERGFLLSDGESRQQQDGQEQQCGYRIG